MRLSCSSHDKFLAREGPVPFARGAHFFRLDVPDECQPGGQFSAQDLFSVHHDDFHLQIARHVDVSPRMHVWVEVCADYDRSRFT